jgi:hypothetical protein
MLAPDVGPREADHVSQDVGKQPAGFDLDPVGQPIDREDDGLPLPLSDLLNRSFLPHSALRRAGLP